MRDKKIIVRLKGGVGNQLFQYAFGRALAHRANAQLVLDDKSGFIRDRQFGSEYRLQAFEINANLASPRDLMMPFERPRRAIAKSIARLTDLSNRTYIDQDLLGDSFVEMMNAYTPKKSVYLDGYWQSAYLFDCIKKELQEELTFSQPISRENLIAAEDIRSKRSVGIHIRFFSSLIEDFKNVPISFYEGVLRELREDKVDYHYLVFSNDPESAAKALGLPPESTTNVNWNSKHGQEIYDLYLMSQCERLIIGNSTFGWWGAWLAESRRAAHITFPKLIDKDRGLWNWDYLGQFPRSWNPKIISIGSK